MILLEHFKLEGAWRGGLLEAEAIIWTLELLLIDGHGARLELLWPISPITARLLLLAGSILIFHVIHLVVIIVDWLWVP